MTNTSYLTKEMELINAMKADDFELFDGSAEEAFDTLEHALESFVTYANTVIRMTVMVPIWKNRFEGEDLRDKISGIDVTDRYQVADFVGAFVSEIYEEGKSKNMDNLVASNSREFDIHKISEDLHNF